jgi:hypothetical protein
MALTGPLDSRELFRTDRSIQDKIAKSLSRTYVQWVR